MVIYLVDPCFGGYIDSAKLFFLDEMDVQVSADPTICEGDSAAIWASGGTQFSWSPAGSVNDPTAPDPMAFPTTTTIFTVQVTADACTETATVTVNVMPAPPLDAGPDVSLCIGEQAQMNATGAVSYQWSPGTGLSSTNTGNPVANPTATTTYTVHAIGTNGCSADDLVTVTVNPLPTAHAYPDTTVCAGASFQAHATGGANYAWNPGWAVNNPLIADPIVTPALNMVLTVTVTDANGCTDKDSLTVTVIPSPFVDAGDDTIIVLGQTVMLHGSTDGVSYAWTPTASLDNPTVLDPVASPDQTTAYVLTATGANGCNSMDTVIVIVLDDAVVAVPTAFTPNGDNTNDFLWIRSLGNVDVTYFRIYNRWGGVVYETTTNDILDNETSGWDGSNKGQEQPMGVYAFVFKGVNPRGETVIQSGNITLIR
jgi:gliding motility-associated-like protein